jgi:glycosyltransferase involved in cell wall biosynthesis
MHNITIITQFFPPETNAAAKRIGSLAEELATKFQVVVITLMPSYPSPDRYQGMEVEKIDSKYPFQIKRTAYSHPHSPSLLNRGLKELQFSLRLAMSAWKQPSELFIVSSPSMFLGLVGWLLARLRSARFLWDIRDITWRYIREKDPKSVAAKHVAAILEFVMNALLKSADLISCATPGIAQQLTNGIVPAERVLVMPNGVTRKFFDAFSDAGIEASDHKPIVTYVGLVGYNQGLRVLVDVASLLPDVVFYIVGDGPELNEIRQKSQLHKVSNIEFTGYLGSEEINAIYKKSTILFAQLNDTPTLNSTGNPSKLLEYMAVGKPIIYAGKGFAEKFLQGIGCSVVVPPGDAVSIAGAVTALLNHIPRMQSMGVKGRTFVRENYLREVEVTKFVHEIEERFQFSLQDLQGLKPAAMK